MSDIPKKLIVTLGIIGSIGSICYCTVLHPIIARDWKLGTAETTNQFSVLGAFPPLDGTTILLVSLATGLHRHFDLFVLRE